MPRDASRVPGSQTVAFATLGCKTNQFESAAMQETLIRAGYQILAFEQGADLVIVNTCTVTSATDAQSRNLIRRARRHNPACRVIVTGCYAQIDPQALRALPGVGLVLGNEEKQALLDYLEGEAGGPSGIAVSDIRQTATLNRSPLTSFAGRSRAFVQIQNGCDAFCSYCIIPYARGASRSAAADDIICQVKSLVSAGFQEIVLTGIHIGGYGADLAQPLTLLDLLCRIEQATAVHRLRLGSLEPTEISDELLAHIAASPVICPHLHIPLQAGDDLILQRMGRPYDTAFFAALLQKVRSRLPDAAICLDVITGFPGESDASFTRSRDFIDSLPITDLHVFPYSRRPGTPAAGMAEQVPGDVSRARAEVLRHLAAAKQQAFARRFLGRRLEVVVEAAGQGGQLKGVSRNYLAIRFAGAKNLIGQAVAVLAEEWQPGGIKGRLDGGKCCDSIILRKKFNEKNIP